MSTPRRTLIIAALLLFTSMAMPVASAQPGLLPGIEVTCNNSETAVNFDVLQTSVLTVFCTIENPTLYSEEVEIEYDATGLAATGLESTTLAAGDDLQFEVVITAPDGGDTQPAEFNITVTATVTSVQGIDWTGFGELFAPSDESNILIAVQPYSAIEIDISPNYLKLEAGGMPGSVNVLVRNMGNAADNYSLTLNELSLTNKGFNVSITPDASAAPMGAVASFTITLIPPGDLDTEVIQVDITISSNMRQMSSTEVFNINATSAPAGLLDLSAMNIPSWAYIAAAVLAGLVVLAVVISIGKKLGKGASRYLDEDEFEVEDDLGASVDEDDDLDDLDDLDLDDFDL